MAYFGDESTGAAVDPHYLQNQKAQAYTQQQHSGGALRGAGDLNAAQQQESLASLTPRVFNLAQSVTEQTQMITASLGISAPTSTGNNKESQPTLMSVLLRVEDSLREASDNLTRINRHLNG